mgnify:CR=1 FL=1
MVVQLARAFVGSCLYHRTVTRKLVPGRLCLSSARLLCSAAALIPPSGLRVIYFLQAALAETGARTRGGVWIRSCAWYRCTFFQTHGILLALILTV